VPVEQVRRRLRHEVILEAALGVFTRKGYQDTAVDDIADQSDTSKGGVYFHFPNKQAIFLALLDRMAAILRSRVESALAAESDPIRKLDAALQVILETFASHRTLSRLFLVEAVSAGREPNKRFVEIRASFAQLITEQLDEAVRQGSILPLDTIIAGRAWFGALNEVVVDWVLTESPGRLENAYPALRGLFLSSIGIGHTGAAALPDGQTE
jgi:AcrR family transcriptional regulator